MKQDKVRFRITKGVDGEIQGMWHITLLEGQEYTIRSHVNNKWETIRVVSVERDEVEVK